MKTTPQLRAIRAYATPLFIAALPSLAAASMSYTLQRADDVSGFGFVQVQGLTEAGQVLVSVEPDINDPNRDLAEYIWQNGHVTHLPIGFSRINDLGWVAGQTGVTVQILKPNGQTETLRPPPAYQDDLAILGLNDSDQAVGFGHNSSVTPGSGHALYWDHGKLTDLGTFGATQAAGVRINQHSQILIDMADGPNEGHRDAALWDDGKTIPIKGINGDSVTAFDLNDAGEVVGSLDDRPIGETQTAFLWKNGVMQDLPALPGDKFDEATAINDLGQIVGISWDERMEDSHPVMWVNGKAIDLSPQINSTGEWSQLQPNFINDRGQIAGVGVLGDPKWSQLEERSFILQPNASPSAIPLPSSLALVLPALPLLFYQLRRRRFCGT